MSKNTETISAIYAAFGRGDVPAILEHLADDVAWDAWNTVNEGQAAGVPWLQERRGKEGVTEFFKVVAERMTFSEFNVLALMENENQVIAELVMEMDIIPSGGHIRDESLHMWKFNDEGKVVLYRHYIDTAGAISAYRGESGSAASA